MEHFYILWRLLDMFELSLQVSTCFIHSHRCTRLIEKNFYEAKLCSYVLIEAPDRRLILKINKGKARRNWVKKSKIRKLQETVPKSLYYDTAYPYVRSSEPSSPFRPLSLPYPAPPRETLKLPRAFLNTSYLHLAPLLRRNSSKTSEWILLFDLSFWTL